HLVGTPVFGQLDRGTSQISVVLLQLGFKASKEVESISGRSGKTGQNLVLVKPADLLGGVFNHPFPQRDLPISRHYNPAVAVDAEDSRRADTRLIFLSLRVDAR